jgi:hypothetical protein
VSDLELAGVVDAALDICEQEEETARRILELIDRGEDRQALALSKEYFQTYYGEEDDSEASN